VIGWSDEEKEVLMSSTTSKEAIEKYYAKFPRSNRTKSSLYTYWWWRKQEEKKKVKPPVDIVKKEIVKKVKKDLADEFGKDTDKLVTSVVHARIVESNNVIEVGDMIKYARTPDAPVGIVVSIEDRKGIPKMSQKIKVNFGNYYMRDVYVCDYKIVRKRVEL
jgi:hypothetical protein